MLFILPEITPSIISLLSREDIYECMKTSKKHYSLLAPLYYQKVVLYNNTHKKFFEAIDQDKIDGIRIGDFVKYLEFHKKHEHSGRVQQLDETQFYSLIKRLPQLQQIILRGFNHDAYLNYLMTIPQDDITDITEISIGNDTYTSAKAVNKHFQLSLRFSDRVRTLKCMNYSVLNVAYNMEKELRKLERLEYLYIDNIWIKEGSELFPLLDACPNLIKFEGRCVFMNKTFVPGKGIIHTKLKTIIYNMECLTDEQLDYTAQHLPNLQTLKLCIHYKSLIASLTSMKEDTVQRFYSYLRKIRHVQLKNIAVHKVLIPQDMLKRAQLFIDLIRGVSGDNAHCNLKVQFQRLPLKNEYFFLDKHGQNVTITGLWLMEMFNYGLWTKQIDFLNFTSITIINTSIQTRSALPHFNNLEPVNNVLIKPVIKMLKKQKRSGCPILLRNFNQHLVFYNLKNAHFYPAPLYGTLLRRHHFVDQDTQSTVNYGAARRLCITDELLLSLGELYPSVEHLTLEKCAFENKGEVKRYGINLSRFNDIHVLTFDLDSILSFRKLRKPMYILVNKTLLDTVDVYSLDERGSNELERIEGFTESDIPQSSYAFKISCNWIRQIHFERRRNTFEIVN